MGGRAKFQLGFCGVIVVFEGWTCVVVVVGNRGIEVRLVGGA